ncbi:MAG TPA: MATE family efflux transporter [Bacteroidales bacterium]|jgi:putative MATE family efflux protein|nr:MATE family efflux transporter [Bacteroidales bacterium]
MIKRTKQSYINLKELVILALPVIATSFLSIAYNIINVIFVGKLGSDAVAAVGSAGFFMHLSWGVSTLFTVGAGIKVSHALGNKNSKLSKSYVRTGIQAIIIVSLIYYAFIAIFRNSLIGIVGINNLTIEHEASKYLLLIALSIPFTFQNLFFTSVLIGTGDSKTPFRVNAIAFALNMILDPLLIFGAGWGIYGTAVATFIAQGVASVLFYIKINKVESLRPIGVPFQKQILKQIMSLGISPTIQRISFTIIAIGMARIISQWGASAIAVQKVGIQIEAITFMTAGGFMTALAALSGKAFGAKNYEAQWNVFKSGIILAFMIGILTSSILILFPESLFSLFLSEKESIEMGRDYLIILGYSQLFMCLELMATGAFFGWGRTNIPAITGISLTLLRIPMALLFIHFWSNSLSSVWWSISISSMAKGSILVLLFVIMFKSFKKVNSVSI